MLASIVGIVAVLGLIAALLAYRSAKDQERRATSAQRVAVASEAEAVAAKTAQEKATAEQQALGASSRWFSAAAGASEPVDRSVASLYAYESLAATPGGGEAASLQVRRGLATADHYLRHDPAQIVSAAASSDRPAPRPRDDGRSSRARGPGHAATNAALRVPGLRSCRHGGERPRRPTRHRALATFARQRVELKLLDMATRTELVADDDAGEYFSR